MTTFDRSECFNLILETKEDESKIPELLQVLLNAIKFAKEDDLYCLCFDLYQAQLVGQFQLFALLSYLDRRLLIYRLMRILFTQNGQAEPCINWLKEHIEKLQIKNL